ncbi:hypothetical protein M0R72_03680 [Candidatus Pacearchaeota archaeon]|jgi:hypothetical protein|nr:hypothetical protein [Candidatus Pacearchaeota archaeon]
MLEQSVKLVDELLSCDGVTAFTTTELSESEAEKYRSLPKKYDVVFTPIINSGYSVFVEPKITPKNIVRDFGIDKLINRILPLLVASINDYSDERRLDSAIGLAYSLISMDVNNDVFQQAVNKYSSIMDSVPSTLLHYVLEYIIDEANKSKFPIALTTNEVQGLEKVGVQYA